MRQLSVKNDHTAALLEPLARPTGKRETEVMIDTLEAYRAELVREADTLGSATIKRDVHPHVLPGYRGKSPSKAELEDILNVS